MFTSDDGFVNYRECDKRVRVAGKRELPIVGQGDVTIAFRSERGRVRLKLRDVFHVPQLGYNLISFRGGMAAGHNVENYFDQITIFLKDGDIVPFPFMGNLPCQYGQRVESHETACAVIAPGKAKAPTASSETDINEFHCTYGHAHEVLLKATAKQIGQKTSGTLRECYGCSMAKGLSRPIARSTHTRAVKKLARVFVDLSGRAALPSLGGKWYIMIVRDDCTRWTRVFFLRKMSGAATAFERYLAEVRADGTPSEVLAVRSDNGGQFFEGDFGSLCHSRGIKQEFTPAYSPQFNGVVERALGIIKNAALAARLQAPLMYPGAPSDPTLWAEAVSWSCAVMNRTATKTNPGNRSPYEMWHGSPPPKGEVWPFLRPAVCKVHQKNKTQLKAQECFYLG
ncbi:unnamed protein product, partial [Scytosiphon promiscuus]